VAGVAVGYRNEFHGSSSFGELGSGSAELAIAIVRVSAERNHTELAILRLCHSVIWDYQPAQ
jgi:hypothetical protein